MKRCVILSILLLVVVSACAPQNILRDEDKKIIPNEEVQQRECSSDVDCTIGRCSDGSEYKQYACSEQGACILINYVRNPCEQIQIPVPADQVEQSYTIGSQVQVGNEQITIKDIATNGQVTLQYKDQEIILYGTKNPAKIGNKEISFSKMSTVADPASRYVILKVEDIILNKNEYALEYKKPITIAGKKVTLVDVETDDLKTIKVAVSFGQEADTQRINKGTTKEIVGLKITNIRSNSRPISYEKYAIVRAE